MYGEGKVRRAPNYPRIVPCAIYAPGRNISQIAIKVDNVPGALAEVASKMTKHGINILSGLLMAEPGGEHGIIVLFLDFTNSSITVGDLVEELRSLPMVRNADMVVRQVGHMAIDGTTYLTTFLGDRVVVLDVMDMGAMFNWLIDTFGTGGRAILFDMGLRAGARAAKKLKEDYGLSGRELVETFLALHVAAGWFDYEITRYDEAERTFTIKLFENFECLSLRGHQPRDRPTSVLVKGVLTGIFRAAYGSDLVVDETLCIAKGDDYCEFSVKRESS